MDYREEAGEKERKANDQGNTTYLAAITRYPRASIGVNELIATLVFA